MNTALVLRTLLRTPFPLTPHRFSFIPSPFHPFFLYPLPPLSPLSPFPRHFSFIPSPTHPTPPHPTPPHPQYISILLNLEYSLKCDAWVCTLASNSCRLIDELRATVGGKANYVFADLSKESCDQPPCYDGEHVVWVDWRRRLEGRY